MLFTEMVDSTTGLNELGDRRWRDVVDEYERTAELEVRRFQGGSVKTTGDGILAVFDCARFAARPPSPLHWSSLRAGIHTGEVELGTADIGRFASTSAAAVTPGGDGVERTFHGVDVEAAQPEGAELGVEGGDRPEVALASRRPQLSAGDHAVAPQREQMADGGIAVNCESRRLRRA